jgi:hypothetical protein
MTAGKWTPWNVRQQPVSASAGFVKKRCERLDLRHPDYSTAQPGDCRSGAVLQ